MEAGELLHVPITVTLELEWVLRLAGGLAKQDVLHTFTQLLAAVELAFASEAAIEAALLQYSQGKSDFADCLHVALARQAGEEPLWTFDKAASRVAGASLLPA